MQRIGDTGGEIILVEKNELSLPDTKAKDGRRWVMQASHVVPICANLLMRSLVVILSNRESESIATRELEDGETVCTGRASKNVVDSYQRTRPHAQLMLPPMGAMRKGQQSWRCARQLPATIGMRPARSALGFRVYVRGIHGWPRGSVAIQPRKVLNEITHSGVRVLAGFLICWY